MYKIVQKLVFYGVICEANETVTIIAKSMNLCSL